MHEQAHTLTSLTLAFSLLFNSLHRKMAEVEITSFVGSGGNHKPRFTLRIITEQKHASEIVQMLTDQRRIRSTVGPMRSTYLGVSAVTAEVDDASQDQTQIYAVSSSQTETDGTLPTEQPATSLDLQTTSPNEHCVTATVHQIGISDKGEEHDEKDASDNETLQYYPALS